MCKYCEDKFTFTKNFKDVQFVAEIHDNAIVSRIGDCAEANIYIDEINYCPMCGKKLKKPKPCCPTCGKRL